MLLGLLALSAGIHFEEITFIGFFTNLFAFLFANCLYFRMDHYLTRRS